MARPKPDVLWRVLELGPPDWLAATTLFGWSLLLILSRIVFNLDFIGPRLILFLAMLGLLLSGIQGFRWLAGAMDENGRRAVPVELQLENAGRDRYSLSAMVMPSKRRPGPRAPDPTRGGYTAWWVFIRMPMVLGAMGLTGIWTIVSLLRGGYSTGGGPQGAQMRDMEGPYDPEF